jgi:hypothetical protein
VRRIRCENRSWCLSAIAELVKCGLVGAENRHTFEEIIASDGFADHAAADVVMESGTLKSITRFSCFSFM